MISGRSYCWSVTLQNGASWSLLSVILAGSILHSHLPLYYAASPAYTWCDPPRGSRWDHLLPLPRYCSPFRSPGKNTNTVFEASALSPVHRHAHIHFYCLTFSGVDGCWYSDLLLICNWLWVPYHSWELQPLSQWLLQVGRSVYLQLFFK